MSIGETVIINGLAEGYKNTKREDILKVLIKKLRPYIKKQVSRVCPTCLDKDDLIQIATIKIINNIDRWDESKNIFPFVRVCTKNVVHDELRKTKIFFESIDDLDLIAVDAKFYTDEEPKKTKGIQKYVCESTKSSRKLAEELKLSKSTISRMRKNCASH